MKNIFVVLFLLLANSVQASTHEIEARYQGSSFAALTGDQDNALSDSEKSSLLQARAEQVCRFFFAGSTASLNPSSLVPAQGDALFISEDGDLIKTSIAQTTPPGHLGSVITGGMDINEGLVFTKLICQN